MKQHRARGFYIPTGKESWITKVWRATKEEAEDDIKFHGHNYKNFKIVERA